MDFMRPSVQELFDAKLLRTNSAENLNKIFFDEAYQGFLTKRQRGDLGPVDESVILPHFHVIDIFLRAKKCLIERGAYVCAEILRNGIAMVDDRQLPVILQNLKYDRPFIRTLQLLGNCVLFNNLV